MNTETFIESFGHIADAPGGIGKLRALILDLAVRGRLTTQDPDDEPASALLERIRAERDRMVQAKEIRKPKPLPPIEPEEAPYDLPSGWEWMRLGEMSQYVRGVTYSKSDATNSPADGKVALLRANNIDGDLNETKLVYVPIGKVKPEQMIVADDIVLAMSSGSANLVGKCARAERDYGATFGAFCGLVRPVPGASSYLVHYLQSPVARELMIGAGRGIGINNLRSSDVQLLIVGCPPVAEQQRIVAKVDQLMQLCDELDAAQSQRERTRVDLGVSTLRHLAEAEKADLAGFWKMFADNLGHHLAPGAGDQAVLKELRRTILDLAVRGRLTKQDPSDEPASVLLERIRVERGRMVQAKEMRKPKQLPSIDPDEVPYELPTGWEWVRLGDILRVIRGITFPASVKARSPIPGHTACLRTTNVQQTVEWHDLIYVPDEYVKRGDQRVLDSDIMISMANSRELVGKVAPVLDVPVDATFGGFIAAIRVDGGQPRDFVLAVLSSPRIQELFRGEANQTTNIANVSVSAINEAQVGLPPIDEQHRIISAVSRLMELCDELERQFSHAETSRRDLAASIVRHAVEARPLATAG